MGDRFNRKAFLYLLPFLLTLYLGVAIPLTLREQAAVNTVLQVAAIGLVTSVALSMLIASYRFFVALVVGTYRSVVRPLAKHAIRSSLEQAMTPMTCTGILDRNGTVHLKVALTDSNVIGEGDQLYVHEEVDDGLWGVVRVVEYVEERSVICTPIDRTNSEFWEHLEDRMRFDTGAPNNVYLVRSIPSDFQRAIENFLNDWR